MTDSEIKKEIRKIVDKGGCFIDIADKLTDIEDTKLLDIYINVKVECN